jgi:hypothetical protein
MPGMRVMMMTATMRMRRERAGRRKAQEATHW